MNLDDAVKLGIKAIKSASADEFKVYHVPNEGNWDLIHDAFDAYMDP